MAQTIINGYVLDAELQNANSGFSKWGFATRNGKRYFIKELITPVYPMDPNVMTEQMFTQQRISCGQFEEKFQKFYTCLNNASRGNLVRVNDFFRWGSRYYLVTDKVDGVFVPMEAIARLDKDKKLLLLKSIAHSFNDLHSAGIIHFDVKPANILLHMTKRGNYVARLIDFDSGFFKGETLDNQELGGDLTYLAPETFLGIYGEDVHPDEKADIFALGLAFHEYYCGKLPQFDTSEYEYPYEVSLDGGDLVLDKHCMPEELSELIEAMLDADPSKRPSAREIIDKLNTIPTDIAPPAPVAVAPAAEPVPSSGWFSTAGDL